MKKNVNSNQIMNIILFLFVIYAIITCIGQQKTLNSYSKEINYYNSQIKNLEDKKEELLAVKENVNSPEYIEEVAREKLDMYLPNEKVFVDISK